MADEEQIQNTDNKPVDETTAAENDWLKDISQDELQLFIDDNIDLSIGDDQDNNLGENNDKKCEEDNVTKGDIMDKAKDDNCDNEVDMIDKSNDVLLEIANTEQNSIKEDTCNKMGNEGDGARIKTENNSNDNNNMIEESEIERKVLNNQNEKDSMMIIDNINDISASETLSDDMQRSNNDSEDKLTSKGDEIIEDVIDNLVKLNKTETSDNGTQNNIIDSDDKLKGDETVTEVIDESKKVTVAEKLTHNTQTTNEDSKNEKPCKDILDIKHVQMIPQENPKDTTENTTKDSKDKNSDKSTETIQHVKEEKICTQNTLKDAGSKTTCKGVKITKDVGETSNKSATGISNDPLKDAKDKTTAVNVDKPDTSNKLIEHEDVDEEQDLTIDSDDMEDYDDPNSPEDISPVESTPVLLEKDDICPKIYRKKFNYKIVFEVYRLLKLDVLKSFENNKQFFRQRRNQRFNIDTVLVDTKSVPCSLVIGNLPMDRPISHKHICVLLVLCSDFDIRGDNFYIDLIKHSGECLIRFIDKDDCIQVFKALHGFHLGGKWPTIRFDRGYRLTKIREKVYFKYTSLPKGMANFFLLLRDRKQNVTMSLKNIHGAIAATKAMDTDDNENQTQKDSTNNISSASKETEQKTDQTAESKPPASITMDENKKRIWEQIVVINKTIKEDHHQEIKDFLQSKMPGVKASLRSLLNKLFIKFETSEDARAACQKLCGATLLGTIIEAEVFYDIKMRQAEAAPTVPSKKVETETPPKRKTTTPFRFEPLAKRVKLERQDMISDGPDLNEIEKKQKKVLVPYNHITNYGLSKAFLQSLGINSQLMGVVKVDNLSREVNEEKLREVFSMAGEITKIDFDVNRSPQAIIHYDHPVEAVQAISMFNGQKLYDKQLHVTMEKYIKENSEKIILPAGLAAIGPGLSRNGKPLRAVRTEIEVKKLSHLMASVGVLKRTYHSQKAFIFQYTPKRNVDSFTGGFDESNVSTDQNFNQSQSSTFPAMDGASGNFVDNESVKPQVKPNQYKVNHLIEKSPVSYVQKPQNRWPEQGPKGPNQNVGPRGPHQNMGPRGSNQNMGPRGSNQNMGPRGPNKNMGPRGPNRDMGPRGPRQNFGPRGPNQNSGPRGQHQNMGPRGPPQHFGQGGPNQNMGPPGPNAWESGFGMEAGDSNQNLQPPGPNPYFDPNLQNLNMPPGAMYPTPMAPDMNLFMAQQVNQGEAMTHMMTQMLQTMAANMAQASAVAQPGPYQVQLPGQANVAPAVQYPVPGQVPAQTVTSNAPGFGPTTSSASKWDVGPPALAPAPAPVPPAPAPPTISKAPALYPNRGAAKESPAEYETSSNKATTSKSEPDMLLFTNLPTSVTSEALARKMREVGELMFSELTGRGRAVVRFKSPRDAKRCLRLFDHSKVDDKVIEVSFV